MDHAERGGMLSTGNLTALFHEMVRTAMAAQQVASSETTEFYLVQLLEGFARPARGKPEFVRGRGAISPQALFRSEQDTLRLHKRWLHTRGRREPVLPVRRGIIPFAPPPQRRH